MRLFHLSLLLIILVSIFPARPVAAEPVDGTDYDPENISTYYEQTGHNVSFEFKRFYDANGGVEVFGLPLTEAISDTTRLVAQHELITTLPVSSTDVVSETAATTSTISTIDTETRTILTSVRTENELKVQYFERARFEYHPELPPEHQITLTRIGSMMTEGYDHPAFSWLSGSSDPNRDYAPESGHTLGGAFRYYWQIKGGLAVFGYPISEEFYEVNPVDGISYLVQYFERARFEYHPDYQGTPYEVQVGLLGKQMLELHPDATRLQQRALPIKLLGQATTSYAASISERQHNIARATDMFNGVVVPPNTEFSFNAIGEFTEENGFVNGYAIIGGRLEQVIAGGLCQVSTTMFRAVSNAGLKITERVGHSFIVNFYENILGFDATVYDPTVDFRWYNDTPGPVYLYSHADPSTAQVTFWVWGYSDGRTVTYEGPYTSGWIQPGPAIWELDPSMPPGSVMQLVHGRSGVDVTYIRTVTLPDGTVLHHDNYYTHYEPWEDFYVYGPGYQVPGSEKKPDTKKPDTKKPDTKKPDTKKPDDKKTTRP